MHHDIGAVVDRLAQIRRRQRVVDDVGHAGALGDLGNRRHVGDDAAGIGDRFGEDRLGLRRDGALERGDVVGVGPHHVPAEILERVGELIDRAAVQLFRGHELVARLQQAMERQDLRRMAGRRRQAGGAAFERGDALLEHRGGRVADARIDVAEGLQAEQRGGVVDAFEHVRCGLVDRRRPRAGRGIGLGAGVDGERGEARNAFAHRPILAILVAGRSASGL